ncbi:putative petal formation-expressed [Lupinus albus]|uniref:Putative petal formation-expressed n=1 Tax=Lupinus albus TaxID=3870 RepID=A0A6A4Q7E4_LUPAL|nr:putative petal formation-expressed [Lupinus albus]
MASIQTSPLFSSKRVNASFHVPKLPRASDVVQLRGSVPFMSATNSTTQLHNSLYNSPPNSNSTTTIKLYSILEVVADRVEMHKNVGEQRDNWNNLLLKNINMITLSASTLIAIAATFGYEGAPLLPLKISSSLLFSAATAMLLIMNKIQPSQLAEEQRIATKLFRMLQSEIQTTIAIGNPTEEDVNGFTEKVLALDKSYPLPLLGVMLEKFPAKYEPAVWWPNTKLQFQRKSKSAKHGIMEKNNGWSEELEIEMREIIEVIKRKDTEDYERLGNIALKVNKTLAIAGPLLTGVAAIGSGFVGNGSVTDIVTAMAGSMAAAINTLEHGGQVGMVFEMYRNCGGFFKLMEETIECTLEEKDVEKRENGKVFEMKMALRLGRSVSQLRQLASKSASGIHVDEFASKLF